MKTSISVSVLFAALAAAAAPVVSDIEIVGSTVGRVKVEYRLSEDAVITPRFKVGGEWLDDGMVTVLSGDVCRKVSATTGDAKRSFTWTFRKEPRAGEIPAVQAAAEVELVAWSTNCPPQYMAINLESPYDVKYYVSSNAVPCGVTNIAYKTSKMLMRKIPSAYVEFRMGMTGSENGLSSDHAGIPHAAMLTKDFYIGVYEITQRQMQLIGGIRSSGGSKTDEAPDTLPSNGEVFNTLRGGAGKKPTESSTLGQFIAKCNIDSLDLPYEAQWEFACRGGTLRRAPGSSQLQQMTNEMWVADNNDGKIHAVGTKLPNPYGLYDMLGNMWEICKDKFAQYEFVEGETSVDPFVLTDGTSVVRRGGGYANGYQYGGYGVRVTGSPSNSGWDYGYRLVCDALAY